MVNADSKKERLPLEGIRVIDHGVVYTGPAATTILADMGAQVIRIESIGRFPSMTRGFVARPPKGVLANFGYPDGEPGERPWDRWYQLHAMNRNKLAITLELNKQEGKDVYKKIVAISDVIIENFSQGTMDRLGLSYETLKVVNPGIIMISASGLGKEGPYRGYSTFGSNIDAITGMMSLRGYQGDHIMMRDPSPVWSDNVAAGIVAFAALVALRWRERTGKGQNIDLSQAETFLPHMGETILNYTMNGKVQEPIGNDHDSMSPHGCYRCKGNDKWVTIAVSSDKEWKAFRKVIGNPSWTQEDKFDSITSRWENRLELNRFVEEWTLKHEPYEIMYMLQKEGIAAGPVIGPADALDDPHLAKRNFFHEITHREAGSHKYPGMFFKFSKTPAEIRIPAPCLGEHNEYVFREILGLSNEEIKWMEKEQIIGTAYLPDA